MQLFRKVKWQLFGALRLNDTSILFEGETMSAI